MHYSKMLIICASSLSLSFYGNAQTENPIRLNQCGYYPDAPKLAVVIAPVNAEQFFVVSNNRDTVFSGIIGTEKVSTNSDLHTRLLDFSALNKEGSYVIEIPGLAPSYRFNIQPAALAPVAIAVLKGYYYQRASMPLEEKYAGKWARAEGHPDNKILVHANAADNNRPEGTILSTPGGWYDAGDYNKYIVNSGITMGMLLSAYEDYPAYFKALNTNIPESENEVPDILDEAIYNLRWMLAMQDPNDGGVYHKCTNASFDPMIMPDKATKTRYVVQKSTGAALDFAAVAAQAARVLKPFLPALADSCLDASKSAWKWALKNPSLVYNQDSINKIYKPAITTGAYGDKRFSDEWLWAAAELYVTTKDNQYEAIFKQHLPKQLQIPNWGNVAMLAYYSMLRHDQTSPLAIQLKEQLLSFAVPFKNANTAFNTIMGWKTSDFVWGSNDVAAQQGVLMLFSYRLTGDKSYLRRALDNLDYILGRNATGYSFLTGFGTKTPLHPHHRLSIADKIADPVPGLVAGGPNPGRQDKSKYEFTDPERAYTDVDGSYASNEIAINWNAPLVYLANAIEALQKEISNP